MGTGVYSWADLETAQSYRDLLQNRPNATELRILEFSLLESNLDAMNCLDLRNLDDDTVNAFLDEYTQYGAGKQHGYDYIIRSANFGDEHYFNTSVVDRIIYKGVY